MQDLDGFFAEYWPHLVLLVTTTASALAAVHAAMTKQDVRAAIGWVAVVLFSPVFGVLFYLVAGVNRVRYSKLSQQRKASDPLLRHCVIGSMVDLGVLSAPHFAAMKTLGDRVGQFPLTSGNRVSPLSGGDEAYPAMLEAIRAAQVSIALGSYIFDNDPVGQEIADALAEAVRRGVEVRVLVDAIGAKYSRPSIVRRLNRGKVPTALFMSKVLGLRLPYANLRSHRKLLVVDGRLGFSGGMNIRAGFVSTWMDGVPADDAHFRLEGPAVVQLMEVFAHDWEFTTGESLHGETWFPPSQADCGDGVLVRMVASGPDQTLGATHDMMLGAFSIAQRSIKIQSPYFLPDQMQISALTIAAQRGVQVDVVIPGKNNLRLVDYAMTAQLEQLVRRGVRVWRADGVFDHAKLMTVDSHWSYTGSSNMDPRSMRLNFELDMEVYDTQTARWIERRIEAHMAQSTLETLEVLRGRPFLKRLRNRVIWLATPYL